MKSEDGGITAGAAAGPDRTNQAARAGAYLAFLLRALSRSKPAPRFPRRPGTRVFMATIGRD